jgi:subtilase family serine protease
MASGSRYGFAVVVAAALGITVSLTAVQQAPELSLPDYDIRAWRGPASPPAAAVAALNRARNQRGGRARMHPHTGALRTLDNPQASLPPQAAQAAVRNFAASLTDSLGLDGADLAELTPTRDFTSRSTGVRTASFAQSIDGIPVFDGVLTIHAAADGTIVRVTSSAGRGAGRRRDPRAPRSPGATEVWFPMDGTLRLAWHSVTSSENPKAIYDLITDAETGELLLRRNRVRHVEGAGRVMQSADAALLDPRRLDPTPLGAGGPDGCPPPINHLTRSLTGPFRDPATILGSSGYLKGNNTHVYRRVASAEGAIGSFDGTAWLFDFPFGSEASAETGLFFAMNFAHDFFYDLGFDEAAGNFQADNFGRGGAAGDPLFALARAEGRNNAYYSHAPDGSSPTIAMFLWDGSGCWAQDVDGDGTLDIDGDHDTDIIIHEFHHGVSLRLNTAWTGDEAGAIGEGGGDFFAYSVNGDTTLAEHSYPGGIRSVNSKTYADWFCLFGLFCSPHSNGEIWANALWDVRGRFLTDLVRGSEDAAVNESHQLYIDALKLSPPAPTMLDMRDAMLLADSLRNPGTPRSENFCRIWEPFAGRGMGAGATDTADNGFNSVTAAYDVPEGCQGPPAPPTITVTVVTATAYEAGPINGIVRINRDSAQTQAVTVHYTLSGSATHGTDYSQLPGSVAIPADAASADVVIAVMDDTLLESNETVQLSVKAHPSYVVGSPSSGTVTLVSDDVAPDLIVPAFSATKKTDAGGTAEMTDTTKNQGEASSPVSTTSYYLSKNTVLDSSDTLLGGREVPVLSVGAMDTGTATVVLPNPLDAGTYWVFAKADGPEAIVEPNETNNKRATSIQIGPDLIVTAISGPAAAAPGAAILVSDTTKNDGGGPAIASLTRFYLSANAVFDTGDEPLQGRSVQALAVGASSTSSTSVTIPAATPAGLYYIFAKADGDGTVPESVETNNARGALLRIGPDLTVTSVSVPSLAASGATLSVTDTTTNSGAGPAGASTTAWYVSSNGSLDAGDTRLSTDRSVPALAPGQASVGTTTVTLPQLAPGTWFVLAKADDTLAVPEARENNNTKYAAMRVGPDLTISSVSIPSSAVSGGPVVVSHTVKNGGAEAAGASAIKFYLSTNVTLDAADIDLGTVTGIPPLAGGASTAGSTTLTLPAGLSGTFYLFMEADGTKVVPEFNESNNKALRKITIAVPTGTP